ncbi:MAG: four helix bundle protein [Cytophagales bacterium]
MKHNFRNMKIWQLGMDLLVDVYALTKKLPNEEKFGLVSQMNRCAVSIPSNIAEGSGRSTNKDFASFLHISLGSVYELETQIIASYRLKYISNEEHESIIFKIVDLEKMIKAFINSLNS